MQQRHIVGLEHGLIKLGFASLAQCVVEAHGTGQAEGRHHFLDGAHHEIDDGAFDATEFITHGAQHDVLDGAAILAVLQRLGEVLNDDDCLGA